LKTILNELSLNEFWQNFNKYDCLNCSIENFRNQIHLKRLKKNHWFNLKKKRNKYHAVSQFLIVKVTRFKKRNLCKRSAKNNLKSYSIKELKKVSLIPCISWCIFECVVVLGFNGLLLAEFLWKKSVFKLNKSVFLICFHGSTWQHQRKCDIALKFLLGLKRLS